MRGPAYTEEETTFIRERVQAGDSGIEIVSAFMEKTRARDVPGFPDRTVDAVTQKVRKMMPKPRPSARAKHSPAPPVKGSGSGNGKGAQAELKVQGVTITGPERHVLAVAQQLA